MSAQAGVLFFDRRPVDPALISELGARLDSFGPDTGGAYTSEGVAMVYRGLHVTPEDRAERQPYTSVGGNVMTWDGRLDNRDELLFQLWRDLQGDTTDVALALATYERWGQAGLSKLVGDWSCTIFDRAHDAVIFASDYMGIRPLYVYAGNEAVWWATTLECLVEQLGLYDDVEPRFIVGVLSTAVAPGLTPYKRVVSIPAGCSVTLSFQGAQQTSRFWTFDVPRIQHRLASDYEGHLRQVFIQAVRGRLRSTGPVWAELSGGLDSSSIVCAAHVLMRDKAVSERNLETVSYVPEPGSTDAGERHYAEMVDAFRGRPSHYLQSGASELDEWSWVTPRYPAAALRQAYALVRQSGGHVLMGGEGGDTVMANYRDHYYDVADLLPRKPIAAVSLARRRALAAQQPIWHVMRNACWELLPSGWLAQRRLTAVSRRTSGHATVSDAGLADVFVLKPEYVPLWREEQLRGIRRQLDLADVAHRRLAGELVRLADGRDLQGSEEPGILRSYPFLDRFVVEFVLGTPMDVLAPPGLPRGLMRRAFESFVPPRVIRRFSKGYAAASIVRNARPVVAHWLRAPEAMRVVGLECVDPSRLQRYLKKVSDNAQVDLCVFTAIFALEQWLTAREHRRRGLRSAESIKKGGEHNGVSEAIA